MLLIHWSQVACDEDLREQIGNNIHFDLVDYDKVRSFRVQIQMPFMVFKVRALVLSCSYQLAYYLFFFARQKYILCIR